jgi:hypothetical protein
MKWLSPIDMEKIRNQESREVSSHAAKGCCDMKLLKTGYSLITESFGSLVVQAQGRPF